MSARLKIRMTARSLLSLLLLSSLASLCSALYFPDEDNPFASLQEFVDSPDLRSLFYNQQQQQQPHQHQQQSPLQSQLQPQLQPQLPLQPQLQVQPTTKLRNPFQAQYPVVKTTYDVELMRPIETMPGKKTVTLYVIPQNALKVHASSRRFKRASLQARFQGFLPDAKYPQYTGLTDGYHIPGVEIPLRRPLTIRSVEAQITAPAGFMVPYHGSNGFHPYPMNTGCLIAPIPPNVPVSPENPYQITRMFAVPGLPEYPTYKPALEQHNHLHIHGQDDVDLAETVAGFFPSNTQSKYAVFELLPVTEKSKKKKKKKKKDSEEEDEEDDEEKTTTTTEGTTTTTTTTTTTEATTTTTTTEATTTEAAASSIQDIIASLGSTRRFEQERVSGSRGGGGTSPSNPFRNFERSKDLASRETSYLQQLRQQSLRRQLDQLQKLLSSLNLGSDRSLEATK